MPALRPQDSEDEFATASGDGVGLQDDEGVPVEHVGVVHPGQRAEPLTHVGVEAVGVGLPGIPRQGIQDLISDRGVQHGFPSPPGVLLLR